MIAGRRLLPATTAVVSLATKVTANSMRPFTTWSDHTVIAKAINKKFPNEDPRGVQDRKIPQLVRKMDLEVSGSNPEPDQLATVKSLWLELYEKRLHDAAFDEAADSGELCDGELHSWRKDRMDTERDPSKIVPELASAQSVQRARKAEREMLHRLKK
ncbi:hypothetical protein FOL47_003124 [Perkinsus chesapeaki]|uniref:Uncharacterized protein n=1 Tax=Perkinsus chesapeaki TaxID=330153 RepID=A0A7J6M9R6_PERCH|nr:hypothetical protein FOL47_003124 [Perkinsus chesapeaki]